MEKDAEKAQADAEGEAVVADKLRAGAAIAAQRAVTTPRRFDTSQASRGLALHVDSPTTGSGGVLQKEPAVFALDAKPQVQSLAALALTRSLAALSAASDQPASLLFEHNVYPLLTSFVPACVSRAASPGTLDEGCAECEEYVHRRPSPACFARAWGCNSSPTRLRL